MNYIANLMIPLMVLIVVGYGLLKKLNIYDIFIEGSKESFEMILSMFPCMLAMIFGINIFLKSGVLNVIFKFLEPLFNLIKIPLDIVPMALMRPISGSSALAILNNVLGTSGPDSFIGRLASVVQGSTDTTFYILTLYFGSIGIKKIRHSLWAGLAADVAGIVAAIVITRLMFFS